MDPQACLERALLAYSQCDYGDTVAALNEYYRWRVTGGFEPFRVGTRGLPGDAVADELANQLVHALDANGRIDSVVVTHLAVELQRQQPTTPAPAARQQHRLDCAAVALILAREAGTDSAGFLRACGHG